MSDKTYFDGIKHVIKVIDRIECEFKALGYERSRDLIALKNMLGELVYREWKYER